jgi:hypothetical protein
MALREQLLLRRDITRGRVRGTRALMIEVPAGRPRQLVLTRGKATPGLRTLGEDRPARKGRPSLSLPIQAPARWT